MNILTFEVLPLGSAAWSRRTVTTSMWPFCDAESIIFKSLSCTLILLPYTTKMFTPVTVFILCKFLKSIMKWFCNWEKNIQKHVLGNLKKKTPTLSSYLLEKEFFIFSSIYADYLNTFVQIVEAFKRLLITVIQFNSKLFPNQKSLILT